MEPFVVSDVGQWSAFFDKLLEVHSKLRGSALNKEFATQTWGLRLVNTATTIGKSGKGFPYFQAVDTGRAPLTTRFRRAGFLAFAGKSNERVFRINIRGTIGENISGKARAIMSTNFDAQLRDTLNKWFATQSEGQTLRLARVRPQQVARKNAASKLKARPEQIAEGTGHVTKAGLGSGKANREDDRENRSSGGRKLTATELAQERESKRLQAEADKWLIAANVDIDYSGNLESETEVTEEIEEATERRSGRFTGHRERAYNKVIKRLANASRSIISEEEIKRQAIVAGNKAAVAEAQRVAFLRSRIAAAQAFSRIDPRIGKEGLISPPIPYSRYVGKRALSPGDDLDTAIQKFLADNARKFEEVKKNPAIKALIKLPNWWMISSIFTGVTGDQVENIWKPLTPSRVDSRNFKLIYANGELESLPPDTGGLLRNSYKLVTNPGLEKLIRQAKIDPGRFSGE